MPTPSTVLQTQHFGQLEEKGGSETSSISTRLSTWPLTQVGSRSERSRVLVTPCCNQTKFSTCESSIGSWVPGSKMTGGGTFLGFQPPSAVTRSPSQLGEKTNCESVPCVGERSPNAEGAALVAGGARRGARRNRDRSELGRGVRLVSFEERRGGRIPASDPNWPVEVLRELPRRLGDFSCVWEGEHWLTLVSELLAEKRLPNDW